MNIKGSKVRFAIAATLAAGSAVVAGAMAWQLATVPADLSEQVSHLMGVIMGIAWTIVMAMTADCHRQGLSLDD